VKEFLRFVGITNFGKFLGDKWFYFALSLAPLFYLCLSLFVEPRLRLNHFGPFLLTQLFRVALPEEFFFRGFLIPYLKTYTAASWRGLSLANIFSAFVFACLHLLSHPPFWALGTFFPALIFGYFREKHDSLWPAVILHFFYNSGGFFFWG